MKLLGFLVLYFSAVALAFVAAPRTTLAVLELAGIAASGGRWRTGHRCPRCSRGR